jgi:hypothetical protein
MLPGGISAPGAQRAFDPRLNNLVLTFVVAGQGGAASVYDAALEVVDGQGQVWLDPPELPAIGEITSGRLTIASENFPAYAPLTLTLRGLELRLAVHGGNLIACGFFAGGHAVLRLQCAGGLFGGSAYALHWPFERRLIVRRWDLWEGDRSYDLELEILEPGSVQSDWPRAATLERFERVTANRIRLTPAGDEFTLRLVAARFELDFRDGQISRIGVFSALGPIGSFVVRDARRFGTSMSVSFRDVLA